MFAHTQASGPDVLDRARKPLAQMTNWNQEFSTTDMDKGKASMWVKIVACWVLALAYAWSMIAPKVLTNREF